MILDASVVLAAFLKHEPDHAACLALIAEALKAGNHLRAPNLLLAEVAGALARQTRSAKRAVATISAIRNQLSLDLAPLTNELALQAADIAANYYLRGADAVYVALSQSDDEPLVTLDKEILERANAVITIRTPQQWLAQPQD